MTSSGRKFIGQRTMLELPGTGSAQSKSKSREHGGFRRGGSSSSSNNDYEIQTRTSHDVSMQDPSFEVDNPFMPGEGFADGSQRDPSVGSIKRRGLSFSTMRSISALSVDREENRSILHSDPHHLQFRHREGARKSIVRMSRSFS